MRDAARRAGAKSTDDTARGCSQPSRAPPRCILAMADADEFDEEYYSDGEELTHDEEDEDGDELIPDQYALHASRWDLTSL